jgi:hypothetical protein
MERMMSASMDFINSVDLENGVFEEKGLRMLEEFEEKGYDTIFGDKKQVEEHKPYKTIETTATPVSQKLSATASTNKYSDLLQ